MTLVMKSHTFIFYNPKCYTTSCFGSKGSVIMFTDNRVHDASDDESAGRDDDDDNDVYNH